MQYWKTVSNGVVISISTVNAIGNGNISNAEYERLFQIIKEAPDGKMVMEDGDDYIYVDKPEPEVPEATTEELFAILIGESV